MPKTIDSVSILSTSNGYIVRRGDWSSRDSPISDSFVFESFKAMAAWLAVNLPEHPAK